MVKNSHREVYDVNGTKCLIDSVNDQIYNGFKEAGESNSTDNSTNIFDKEGTSLQIDSYSTDDIYNSSQSNPFCFAVANMLSSGICNNEECSNVTECSIQKACTCERNPMQLEQNTTLKCLCKLMIDPDNCTELTSTNETYYKKETCFVYGLSDQNSSKLQKCTLGNHDFPPECPYFNSSCALGREGVIGLINYADPLKNTLAMNPLTPFLLLIFHFLLYLRLFSKIAGIKI